MRIASFILALLLLLTGSAFAAQVNLIWDYDYTNDTPCQVGQTTNCLSHFIAFHYDSAGNRVTDKAVTASPTAAGEVTGIQTGFFPVKNRYGAVSYSVIAVAKDATGAFVESGEATAVVNIVPSKPKNPRSQQQ
jgi:hypothetical protein